MEVVGNEPKTVAATKLLLLQPISSLVELCIVLNDR